MRKSIKRLTAAVLFMSITVSSTFFLTACKNNDVSSKNKIVVFNYGDYIDSTLLDKFEKETAKAHENALNSATMQFSKQSPALL